MAMQDTINPITFEIIRNRLIAITEEMRVALQSVSGSPTVTEASDFFTGLFTPGGEVASMGFQVAYHAPVSGAFIRHIQSMPHLSVRDGDMFIGNDPYIAALHQNDVQMVAPIFVGDTVLAWAAVEAHEVDVGGMDFASWCPGAKEVWQEGLRIPCVKLMDQGETREDVLEMIVAASRLPGLLGLDIRAFVATLNVARDRVTELADRYGASTVADAIVQVIASTEGKMRARLSELPDGDYHAADFLEHDGHSNALYQLDVQLQKLGDTLTLDYSRSSKQAPGFINATRAGLMGAVAGSILPTLAWDMAWNEGALKPIQVTCPDGLVCTAQFPAPVGSATVEAVWVTANATMHGLNKILAISPAYRHRAQGLHAGAMATFNLGGINQFGEPFGLHLMDPLAAGSAAFPSRDGVEAGGPITSPVSAIADVERNEQVVPLFYFHRRLSIDTGGAGRFRGGTGVEIALTLGGIERAQALIMTHGAEVPNSLGLGGGFPGATIAQRWGHNAAGGAGEDLVEYELLGPKPGLMPMTNKDVFAVSWQGGGGFGDPLEREIEAVEKDVREGTVSSASARAVYGVVEGDHEATKLARKTLLSNRIGSFNPARVRAVVSEREDQFVPFGESLFLVADQDDYHVVTRVGQILSTNSTEWRNGAIRQTSSQLPDQYKIKLHENLRVTSWYCPISGHLLSVDIHHKDTYPADDTILPRASVDELLNG